MASPAATTGNDIITVDLLDQSVDGLAGVDTVVIDYSSLTTELMTYDLGWGNFQLNDDIGLYWVSYYNFEQSLLS